MYDVIIIGGGIAGLTAAIYAQRAGLTALVLEKGIYGGQMTQTARIDNYPGLPGIDGVTLSNSAYEQAIELGAQVRFEPVTAISDGTVKRIATAEGEYEARALIIANGAARRLVGCEGESRLTGRGVSYCATCDGAFFRKKTVAVVGGGNTALEDALFLANMCERVYLIHRREEFRGDRILSEAVLRSERIEPVLNATVQQITGEKTVDGVEVLFKDGLTRRLEVSGVFVAIGLVPDTELFRGLVELDERGYILAGEDGKTSADGVFAAGDCRSKALRQIITAAADGANAAFSAANYINIGD